ncbi:MAG: hypothetical protein HYZ37_15560 [Candidatus Solibacter usitatus]|nr:hypothetical protein [Candidatus Solibacter usitatus]
MSIDLDIETQRLIEGELRGGSFQDAAEFVSAAVKHFLLTREDLGLAREEIDAMIAASIDSLRRGEGVDGESFFLELEKEERELQRRRT